MVEERRSRVPRWLRSGEAASRNHRNHHDTGGFEAPATRAPQPPDGGRPPEAVSRASGGAAGAGGAALEGATLVLAEATPHAVVLARLERVLEARLGDAAARAHGLRLVDLVDGRP